MADERFQLVTDIQQFKRNIDATILLGTDPKMAVDTETTYRDKEYVKSFRTRDFNAPVVTRRIKGSPNNFPFLVTISTSSCNGYAIYVDHTTVPVLRDILEDVRIAKILHNAKYDFHMLYNIGIYVLGKIWDTHIMVHLVNEEEQEVDDDGKPKWMTNGKPKISKALKNLARKYITKDADKYEKLVDDIRQEIAKASGRKKDEVRYDEVPVDIMVDYACADPMYTFGIFDIFIPKLIEQNLLSIYEIEEGNIYVLLDIERTGHKIDLPKMENLFREIQSNIVVLEHRIFDLVGKQFNIASAEELVDVYQELGVTWQFKTEKGEWETTESALKHYAEGGYDEKVIILSTFILEWRSESKMGNTFVKGILDNTDPDDERVRGNYNQALTVTGRLSMSEPNLQNQDKKDKRARECFVPSSDEWVLVYHDAAQEEYRLLAHYAKCAGLIAMIKKGYDVHRATGAMLYGVPYEDVTNSMREDGKRTNFALVYGLGDPAFAKVLGEPIDEKLYYKGMWGIPDKKMKPWDILKWDASKLDKQLNIWMDKNKLDEETADAIRYYASPEVRKMIQHAKEAKKEYFKKLPEIQDFLEVCKKRSEARGYIFTWAGRRRHFSNPKQQAYKSPNSLIQGGCADILKYNMVKVHKFLKPYLSRIVNNIHDEIQIEYHITELWLIPLVNKLLGEVGENFSIPIDWDIQYSTTSWAKKVNYDEHLEAHINLSRRLYDEKRIA